jgi:uncharacterized membrane protein
MNRLARSAVAGVLGAASLTTAVLVTTSQPVAASNGCVPSVTVLPDLGYGGEAGAFNHDTFVGLVNRANGSRAAAYWRHGRLHLIHPGFNTGTASDINEDGVIVGQANGGKLAWVHEPDGKLYFLPNPTGEHGHGSISARRINSSGQIAGTVGYLTNAARWDSPTQDPVLLPPAPGDAASYVKGINDAGDVAGDTDYLEPDVGLVPHAAVWSAAGDVHVLPGLYDGLGTGWYPGSELFEINDAGVSAGDSAAYRPDTEEFVQQATLWRGDGTPVGLGVLPGTDFSIALGLSSTGEAAGGSSTWDESVNHAFVWSAATGMLALPVPGAASYAESQSIVHQIEGGTVGGESAPDGSTPMRPTVWRCAFAQAFHPAAVPTSSPRRAATATASELRFHRWVR